MNTHVIGRQLIRHEGIRLKPYKCSAGKLTIGVGRNLDDNGITKAEAVIMLQHDILTCVSDLQKIFPGQFTAFPEKIQHVLIDMRYQLGPNGFRRFKRMINAVRFESWPDMILEMRDSAWYRQVPWRAGNLIKMVEEVQ